MRALAVVLGFSLGCAHPRHVARVPAATDGEAPIVRTAIADETSERSIRLVARRPPHHRFVGRVRASVLNDDFVVAAKEARAKLTRRAEALGADVVKIERVVPGRGGQVLMAGRAYRMAH